MNQQTIDRFVTNLSAAFSKRVSTETRDLYFDKLSRWPLTDEQWAKALSRIVAELEYWPTLAAIYPFLHYQLRGRTEQTEPLFRTWHDGQGRFWAQPRKGTYRAIVPSDRDIAEWQAEQCSPDEARAAFRKGYLDFGQGLPETLASVSTEK